MLISLMILCESGCRPNPDIRARRRCPPESKKEDMLRPLEIHIIQVGQKSHPLPKLLRSPSPLFPQPSTKSYGGAPPRPPSTPCHKSRATRVALATHLRPYDLEDNTARMDGLAKQKGRRRNSGPGRKDGGGRLLHRWTACATALSTVTRGTGAGAVACRAGTGTLEFLWRL
jgi:hypothetical protein